MTNREARNDIFSHVIARHVSAEAIPAAGLYDRKVLNCMAGLATPEPALSDPDSSLRSE